MMSRLFPVASYNVSVNTFVSPNSSWLVTSRLDTSPEDPLP